MRLINSLVNRLRRLDTSHAQTTQPPLAEEIYFFPNQSPEVQWLETRLRDVAAPLPEASRLELYDIFSRGASSLVPTSFTIEDDFVLAGQAGRHIAFPNPIPKLALGHIVFGYEQWLQRKYRLPGFVEVEPGDVVIDCGAYVGGFSLTAAKRASAVHAFEPEARNYACVVRNNPNVTANMMGLFNETKTMQFNVSASSVEHSLIKPDDGPPVEVREIQVITLQDYCNRHSIERLDFAKIEAEGVELEVFEGLGTIRPRKFAIDVSPERDGESPAEEFRSRLTALGYVTRQRGQVLFARLDSK